MFSSTFYSHLIHATTASRKLQSLPPVKKSHLHRLFEPSHLTTTFSSPYLSILLLELTTPPWILTQHHQHCPLLGQVRSYRLLLSPGSPSGLGAWFSSVYLQLVYSDVVCTSIFFHFHWIYQNASWSNQTFCPHPLKTDLCTSTSSQLSSPSSSNTSSITWPSLSSSAIKTLIHTSSLPEWNLSRAHHPKFWMNSCSSTLFRSSVSCSSGTSSCYLFHTSQSAWTNPGPTYATIALLLAAPDPPMSSSCLHHSGLKAKIYDKENNIWVQHKPITPLFTGEWGGGGGGGGSGEWEGEGGQGGGLYLSLGALRLLGHVLHLFMKMK